MKIDVHNHFYPASYLAKLEKYGPQIGISVEKDAWDRTILVQNNNKVVTITPPMTDVDHRLQDMDASGFDVQILTLSAPNVDLFPPEVAEEIAKAVNDEIAGICRDNPERFIGFATLPYLDPERSVPELSRCVEELGYKGVTMGTHINGHDLDDKRFIPFYEKLEEYDLPVHIHPRAPRGAEVYKDFRLAPMIGFEMELCVAVVRLAMSGVMDTFSKLNFIVSHLGGAVPYLAERIQNCYEAYPECQENIRGSAMEYLKRFYYDTVSFFQPALLCAHAFAGADHLILGSDYPHVIGDIKEAVTSIEQLNIEPAEKEMIFSGNIKKLIHWGT